jgi:UDP-N-acetylglucosamine 2-epimerase (non-hydrolysing)
MSHARVLTDSGGIQEETTVLGIPCVTLRENTISNGTNALAGRKKESILRVALEKMEVDGGAQQPKYWDGWPAK